MRSYSQKLSWADASGSDCIAILNAYKTWKTRFDQGLFRDQKTEAQWCNRFLLEMRHLHDMNELIVEIKRRLEQFDLTESSGVYRVMWSDKEKPIILKICLAAAFFPNFFERSNNDESSEKLAYSKVGGNDPFNTVFFTNMDNSAIGDLYGDQVKLALIDRNICDDIEKMKVTFDSSSTKVYVTFRGDTNSNDGSLDDGKSKVQNIMAGRVLPEVYKCVKQRRHEPSMMLRIMDLNTSEKYALENNLGSIVNGMFKMHKNYLKRPELCVVPSIFVRFMRGTITHVSA